MGNKAIAAAGILFFGGCAFLPPRPSDWKRCRFEVENVIFQGIRKDKSEWQVDLAVHNPNSRRLKLEGLRVYALAGGDTLADLRNHNPLDLSPRDSALIPLTLALPHSALGSLGPWGKGKGEVLVVGDAYYRTWFGVRKYPGVFRKTYAVDLPGVLQWLPGFLK